MKKAHIEGAAPGHCFATESLFNQINPTISVYLKNTFTYLGSLCTAILLLFSRTAAASSGGPIQASDAFKDFAAATRSEFLNLQSFIMEGTITITHSDDSLRRHDVPKVVHEDFSIWGKGSKLKEIVTPIGDANAVKNYSPATYYLDSEKVVVVTPDDARIFKHGTPYTGLLNDCPAFLEYAFLNGSQQGDIPALLPSDLSAPRKWNSLIQNLKTTYEFQKDGTLRVRISTSEGLCSVDLIPSSGSKNGYQMKSMTCSPIGGGAWRKVEFVDAIHDKNFGDIGKTFKMDIFDGGFPTDANQSDPTATVQFAIKQMQLNPPIDDDTLTFDPASVNRIWDGENKVYITVPK